MQNKKNVIIVVVVLLALFIAGGFIYKSNTSKTFENLSKSDSSIFQRPYSYVVGKEDAKIQLVEFFDPACETCAQFHFLIKDLMKENPEIKHVYRYAPFHQNSGYAVLMLEGAKEQGKFMEVLELMFTTQRMWAINHVVQPQLLWNLLQNVEGLDLQQLSAFISSDKADANIKQDIADIETLGVNKTPSYFVNGKPLLEFGYENLKKLIQSEME